MSLKTVFNIIGRTRLSSEEEACRKADKGYAAQPQHPLHEAWQM